MSELSKDSNETKLLSDSKRVLYMSKFKIMKGCYMIGINLDDFLLLYFEDINLICFSKLIEFAVNRLSLFRLIIFFYLFNLDEYIVIVFISFFVIIC
jgi:hypothetical protein